MCHYLLLLTLSSICCLPSMLAAQMKYPVSVATNGEQVFVADLHLPGIWEISNGKPDLYFEGSKRFREPLNRVRCVAIDREGKLLAGDSATRDIYRINGDKATPLTNGDIGIAMSIATRSTGEIIVADLELSRIYEVPAAGGEPKLLADIPAPRGVFVDESDTIWVISGLDDPVRTINSKGDVNVVVSGRPFEYPSSIVVNDEGTAFVCDSYAKCIWKIAKDKSFEKFSEGAFEHPVSLAIDGDSILLADPRANAIFEIDADGKAVKR